jgi:hypothetical protein
MDKAQREELRRLHGAATPGEWKHHIQEFIKGQFDRVISAPGEVVIRDEDLDRPAHHWKRSKTQDANWDAIVAAHNALPALLDALDRAEEEVETSAKETAHLKAALDQIWATVWDSHYGSGVTAEYARAVDKEVRQALKTETADAWLAARDARMKALGAAEWLEREASEYRRLFPNGDYSRSVEGMQAEAEKLREGAN